DTKWDHVFDINESGQVGLGSFLAKVENLEQDTQYYYRGYASNLGGEQWAPNIETFLAMDTTFTKYTLDGMVLWLDAQDVDGDGYSNNYADGAPMPIWIDKSLSEKHARQAVAQKIPNFAHNVFNGLPAIRFESGDAYNIGSLSVNYGSVQVFMVSKGSGVGIGSTDGITGWSLDTKAANAFGAFKSENNTLQQVSLGFDPRTGYGMLIGEIAEIMVFDRALPKAEQEMVEGYLAHKWGIVDDLAQTGFKIARGLKLYYPFNETDGAVVQDYSAEMRHADVIDVELNVAGKFSSGARFYEAGDFVHNARIDLLQNELEIDAMPWTVSSWFEAPVEHVGEFRYPLHHSAGSSYIMHSSDNSPALELGLFDGTLERLTSSNLKILNNGWHQIAVTSETGNTKFYIDGAFVGNVTPSVTFKASTIGNFVAGGASFAGKLDDFRVYDRTLSSAEISTLYGGGNGDFGVHPYQDFPPSFDNIPEINQNSTACRNHQLFS
ncbi:LamG domain-containing protein, partial [bacterium]|nr:LamG domain-containing protein [bacterium]